MDENQTDPLEGMRGEEHDILKLIGVKGEGFEFVACEGQGVTKYHPAIDEQGNIKPFSQWKSYEDYVAHKVERTRLTIRYTILGNPIIAEDYVRETIGCEALACTSTSLDVYYSSEAAQ